MPLFLLKIISLYFQPLRQLLPLVKKYWQTILPVAGVILLITMIYFKNNTIDNLTEEAVISAYVIAQANAANVSMLETIMTLRSANEEFAQLFTISEAARAAAYRASQERGRRAAIQLDDAKTKLKELENETPTCAEISRIDIGAACPLSVELLRRAATGDFD